jgi:predicted CXXCH cytochrome family protein
MKEGGKRMKKVLIGCIAIVSLLLVTYSSSYAIQGACVNCHTMHNSQNGTRMADQDTPYGYLLRAGCISCHTGATSETNSYTAPIVFHTTAPAGQGANNTLAGGDFYWVATGYGGIDSKGHNVSGLATQEASPMNAPPGFDSGATSSFGFGTVGITWASNQLNCAGTYGCHGNHSALGDFPGIKGAHHGNTGGTATRAGQSGAPTTVGSSYRFLGGIRGLEQSQWNWNETASSHNEYFGVDDTSLRSQTNAAYVNKDTISFLCAECHGFFHSRIDDTTLNTPWLRHPTDIVLGRGAGTEYYSYNPDAANVYSLEAPVARPSVPATSSSTVAPGNYSGDTGAIVMCLSCHRAHGSNQAHLLRWDYTTMIAGTGTTHTGCFTCHTTKAG